MIRASGITKVFPTPAGELQVLRDIDLDIKAGEFAAIIGASGAGKSTLLHILGTLDRPSAGRLDIGGRDVLGMHETELTRFRNRTLGFVFQFHHLLPEFSALENAMMPALIGGMPRQEAAELAGALLGDLGLGNRVEHRPGELSGGEQQRVAMARALVLKPDVLLADEPTGNLDTSTGNELFELLRKINDSQGTTIVIVTHNEALSAQCHRVVEMRDGSISSN